MRRQLQLILLNITILIPCYQGFAQSNPKPKTYQEAESETEAAHDLFRRFRLDIDQLDASALEFAHRQPKDSKNYESFLKVLSLLADVRASINGCEPKSVSKLAHDANSSKQLESCMVEVGKKLEHAKAAVTEFTKHG